MFSFFMGTSIYFWGQSEGVERGTDYFRVLCYANQRQKADSLHSTQLNFITVPV